MAESLGHGGSKRRILVHEQRLQPGPVVVIADVGEDATERGRARLPRQSPVERGARLGALFRGECLGPHECPHCARGGRPEIGIAHPVAQWRQRLGGGPLGQDVDQPRGHGGIGLPGQSAGQAITRPFEVQLIEQPRRRKPQGGDLVIDAVRELLAHLVRDAHAVAQQAVQSADGKLADAHQLVVEQVGQPPELLFQRERGKQIAVGVEEPLLDTRRCLLLSVCLLLEVGHLLGEALDHLDQPLGVRLVLGLLPPSRPGVGLVAVGESGQPREGGGGGVGDLLGLTPSLVEQGHQVHGGGPAAKRPQGVDRPQAGGGGGCFVEREFRDLPARVVAVGDQHGREGIDRLRRRVDQGFHGRLEQPLRQLRRGLHCRDDGQAYLRLAVAQRLLQDAHRFRHVHCQQLLRGLEARLGIDGVRWVEQRGAEDPQLPTLTRRESRDRRRPRGFGAGGTGVLPAGRPGGPRPR